MAIISMTEKSALEMRRSRCRKTGMMASGRARLPKRRAQMAHLEVRMRMRIRTVTAYPFRSVLPGFLGGVPVAGTCLSALGSPLQRSG